MDDRTLEILAQVVYKEVCIDNRIAPIDDFWGKVGRDTVRIAEVIQKVKTIIKK